MIKEYHFGSITINDKIYNYDVEVRWTGEVLKWWRSDNIIKEESKEEEGEQRKVIGLFHLSC